MAEGIINRLAQSLIETQKILDAIPKHKRDDAMRLAEWKVHHSNIVEKYEGGPIPVNEVRGEHPVIMEQEITDFEKSLS
jgi:hypothetical protein